MNLYVVEALRWDDRENHSYIVGVYSDKRKAAEAALAEEFWRGGKYTCEIQEHELDQKDSDAVQNLWSGFVAAHEEINKMIDEKVSDHD